MPMRGVVTQSDGTRLASVQRAHVDEINYHPSGPSSSDVKTPQLVEKYDADTVGVDNNPEQLIVSGDAQLPPDGGLTAWLQVLMGHLMNFNTWGYINSYGLFEAYYLSHLHLPASTLSWPASTQIFLLFLLGILSGRALDAGLYRPVLLVGLFLQLLGVFATSFATEYWHLLLAQGLCQGIGNGLVFTPTVALITTYFVRRRRSLAVSLVLSGSVTGGIVFPLLAQRLLPLVGFAWTVRVMGFVMLFNAAIILVLARTRLAPRKSGPFFEWPAFREWPFSLFTVGTFLALWPVYYAYDYITLFAATEIHLAPSSGLTTLLLLNASAYPGRILPALLSDTHLGPLNTLIFLFILNTLLLALWPLVRTPTPLTLFVLAYGFTNGAVQGIFLSALSSLTPDTQLSRMGARMGIVLGVVGFGTLSGAPIAGKLIDDAEGGFAGFWIFGGVVMGLGTVILVVARGVGTGWRVWVRV